MWSKWTPSSPTTSLCMPDLVWNPTGNARVGVRIWGPDCQISIMQQLKVCKMIHISNKDLYTDFIYIHIFRDSYVREALLKPTMTNYKTVRGTSLQTLSGISLAVPLGPQHRLETIDKLSTVRSLCWGAKSGFSFLLCILYTPRGMRFN